MAMPTIYRVYLKCRDNYSVELVFEGTLSQMVKKYGAKNQEGLKSYVKDNLIYNYTFSVCINYRWKTIADPRPDI